MKFSSLEARWRSFTGAGDRATIERVSRLAEAVERGEPAAVAYADYLEQGDLAFFRGETPREQLRVRLAHYEKRLAAVDADLAAKYEYRARHGARMVSQRSIDRLVAEREQLDAYISKIWSVLHPALVDGASERPVPIACRVDGCDVQLADGAEAFDHGGYCLAHWRQATHLDPVPHGDPELEALDALIERA